MKETVSGSFVRKRSTISEFASELKSGRPIRLDKHASKVFEDYLFQFEKDFKYLKVSVDEMCQFEKA